MEENDTMQNQTATTIHITSVFHRSADALWAWVAYVWTALAPYITTPVILLFILPATLCVLVYFSAMLMYFYYQRDKIFKRLKEAYEEHDLFKAGVEIVSVFWDSLGWIWFGYEVDGLDNIPDEGPAMIIFYHGAIPVDYYYLVAKVLLLKGRVIHSVVDRFLFKLWGMKTFLRAFQCTPGSQESCAEEIGNGHILGLSPGGVFEAQFGDANYEILWKDRIGFAKIALKTGCPIIPVFTQNIRESFRTPGIFRRILRPVYDCIRIPVVPVYGGFPVKLRTIVGRPIEFEADISPDELRDVCKAALQKLIDDNQKKPGSIFRALYQRVSFQGSHAS